ncbi:Uncharacterised protein [Providencia stuartii]|nr:Uncharacterised protein [Providencia stuartii]
MTTPNAAREQDEIIHSSIWADVVSIVAEGVVYAAAGGGRRGSRSLWRRHF